MPRPQPLILLTLCLLSGEALELALFHRPSVFLALFFASLACTILFSRRKRKSIARCFLFFSFFVFGAFLSTKKLEILQDQASSLLHHHVRARPLCEGFLRDDPAPRAQGVSLEVMLVRCQPARDKPFEKVSAYVRLFVKGETEELWQGDALRFEATFQKPQDFFNPAAFSYRFHLASRDISLSGFAEGSSLVRLYQREQSFFQRMVALRHQFLRRINSSMSPDAASIVNALLLGSRGDIDDEHQKLFSLLGIAHILSISGLHVVSIVVILSWILSLILNRCAFVYLSIPRRYMIALLSLPMLWVYVLFVGAPISAIRAACMITFFLISTFFFRRHDSLVTLAGTVLVMCILWPLALMDISFQLSIVSVLGIILTSRFLPKKKWMQVTGSTVGAYLFSAPLILLTFHELTPLGLITNIIVIPLFGFVLMPLFLAASLLSIFSHTYGCIVWKYSGFLLEELLIVFQALLPAAEETTFFAAPTLFQLALCYLLLIVALMNFKRAYRGSLFIMFVLLCSFVWPMYRPQITKRLEVTFFDVGHGDAVLLRFPDGTSWMIDAGGFPSSSFDTGKRILAPALWQLGVRRLETIILSHAHFDHYGGFSSLRQLFHPEFFFLSSATSSQEPEWKVFFQEMKEHQLEVRFLDANTPRWKKGEVEFTVSYPHADLRIDDINDQSLVLFLRYRDVSFLFTGDIETFSEKQIVQQVDLDSPTVLKVAHHGSKTSSTEEFLNMISPRYAVISVGKHHRFRLPHEKVLHRFEKRGVALYRTDRQGAITMSTDGKEISITTLRDLPTK